MLRLGPTRTPGKGHDDVQTLAACCFEEGHQSELLEAGAEVLCSTFDGRPVHVGTWIEIKDQLIGLLYIAIMTGVTALMTIHSPPELVKNITA